MCTSDELEATTNEIRKTRNWVHQIVCAHKQKIQQHEDSTAVAAEEAPCAITSLQELSQQQIHSITIVALGPVSTPDIPPSTLLSGDDKYGSQKDRIHIYPVEFDVREIEWTGETTDAQKYWPGPAVLVIMHVLAHSATVLFLATMVVSLRNRWNSSFVWHPVLMGLMLVLTTEATLILQPHTSLVLPPRPPPPPPPSLGRTFPKQSINMLMQCAATVACIFGVIQCFAPYNELDSTNPLSKSPAHRRVGAVALLLFFIQAVFRLYVEYTAYGADKRRYQSATRHWHKYHWALRYLTLVFLWSSAWLGVHSHWARGVEGGRVSGSLEVLWVFIFAALILGVFVPADLRKLGFK
ncbi:hypothetical protein LPJ66_005276 [Kickxella alabastrina]|uniref:Uncharacterized protein n=1 Tax=Kickxella alabastrina TaxID=61397 RepID=A0ACC1IIZ5_9FUNG|nr:hypothetical protein LPJ66_005276 [Kickxella alabastrina]